MPEPSVSDIRAFHQTWPQYRPTPLIPLPDLAGQLRVGSILVKDEAARMGLGSFKVLGSSWAIHQRTKRLLRSHDPDPWPLEAMRDVLGMHGSPVLCSASDGNHGHALAVLAARLGLACSIYLPAGADLRRIAQIEGEGAHVRLVSGSYTDAVATARAAARSEGLWYCPDTALPHADPDEMSFAADVISGYQTLWEELIEAVSAPPDVVLLQAGVGAFAASAIASVGRAWPDARFFVVEPEGSACVAASMAKGRPTAVVDARTVMEGLRCQEVSAAAWPLLKRRLSGALAIDDEAAQAAVQILAGSGVQSGPSGAAGLAGLLRAARQRHGRAHLGLHPLTSVIVVSTEGAELRVSTR